MPSSEVIKSIHSGNKPRRRVRPSVVDDDVLDDASVGLSATQRKFERAKQELKDGMDTVADALEVLEQHYSQGLYDDFTYQHMRENLQEQQTTFASMQGHYASFDAYQAWVGGKTQEEKTNELLGKIYQELQDDAATRSEQMMTMQKTVLSTGQSMTGIVNGIIGADIGKTYSGVQSILGDFTKAAGLLDNLGVGGGMFAKGGKVMNALGAIGKVLKPVGIALGAMGIAGGLIDTFGDLRQVSLNQTGTASNLGITMGMNAEQQMASFMTNLDSKEIATIQNTLLQNRAKYGTQEYRQGMDFSIAATQQYGISAQKASDMYATAVLKGTMTVEQLNKTLSDLQETVKNTDITMDDAVRDFTEMSANLRKIYGSESAASEASADFLGLFGDSEQANTMSAIASKVYENTGHDYFTAEVARYQREQGLSYNEAVAAFSTDYMNANWGSMWGANDPMTFLAQRPIDTSGRTFADYYKSRDRDGLLRALNELRDNGSVDGMSIFDVQQAMINALSIPEEIARNNEALVNYLFGNAQTNQKGFASNVDLMNAAFASGDTWSDTFNQQATEDRVANSEAVQEAIRNGWISRERASTLTEGQIGLIEADADKWAYRPIADEYGSIDRLGEQYMDDMRKIINTTGERGDILRVERNQAEIETVNGTIRLVLQDDAGKVLYMKTEEEADRVAANRGEK